MELPRRVDVQERERRLLRVKGLEGKMHHDRAVLADGIEHDWFLGFGRNLSNDVDGLGLECIEMR